MTLWTPWKPKSQACRTLKRLPSAPDPRCQGSKSGVRGALIPQAGLFTEGEAEPSAQSSLRGQEMTAKMGAQ